MSQCIRDASFRSQWDGEMVDAFAAAWEPHLKLEPDTLEAARTRFNRVSRGLGDWAVSAVCAVRRICMPRINELFGLGRAHMGIEKIEALARSMTSVRAYNTWVRVRPFSPSELTHLAYELMVCNRREVFTHVMQVLLHDGKKASVDADLIDAVCIRMPPQGDECSLMCGNRADCKLKACSHASMCTTCITKWVNRCLEASLHVTCPMCRTNLIQ